jgi:hypothetical protein
VTATLTGTAYEPPTVTREPRRAKLHPLNWKIMRPTIVSIPLLFACAACSYGYKAVDPNSLTLNPHPQQIVQVLGTIPPQYEVDRLRVTFATASLSPLCNGLNFPDGGPFPLTSNIFVPTTKKGDQIAALVQADRFAPGRAAGISFRSTPC